MRGCVVFGGNVFIFSAFEHLFSRHANKTAPDKFQLCTVYQTDILAM
jgi:hypothetical protein